MNMPPRHHEMMQPDIDRQPREIERFFILDFDRCIANTQRLNEVFEEVVARETVITSSEIRSIRRRAEASGGSFDTAGYVQSRLLKATDSAAWRRLADHFISQGRQEDMLLPSARELFAYFNERQLPYGIMTFGGELWQTAKILAAGLEDVPYMITNTKQKGVVIANWQQADGSFLVPHLLAPYEPLVARHVMLFDDKAVSFRGLPAGADGVYVLPYDDAPLLPSQRGSVPTHVVSIKGLAGSLPVLDELATGKHIDKS